MEERFANAKVTQTDSCSFLRAVELCPRGLWSTCMTFCVRCKNPTPWFHVGSPVAAASFLETTVPSRGMAVEPHLGSGAVEVRVYSERVLLLPLQPGCFVSLSNGPGWSPQHGVEQM